MRTMTVKADGVNVRPSLPNGLPNPKGEPVDVLSRGDKMVYLQQTGDDAWLKGRVTEIQSGRFLGSRLGQEGWVWAHAMELEADPIPLPRPPRWSGWIIAAVSVAVAGLTVWLIR